MTHRQFSNRVTLCQLNVFVTLTDSVQVALDLENESARCRVRVRELISHPNSAAKFAMLLSSGAMYAAVPRLSVISTLVVSM